MNTIHPVDQLEQAREYLEERGFMVPVGLTTLRMRTDIPNGSHWDGIGVEMDTGRWTAYTIVGNTRPWESTEPFDDPIEAYLHAELSNWGRS